MRAGQNSEPENSPVSFSELSKIPGWLNWSDEDQKQLAVIAAIFSCAAVIERELSGEKLRALAQAAGNDLFDFLAGHYLDANMPLMVPQDKCSTLPRPEDLERIGRQILLRSLPLCLRPKFPEASDEIYARQIATLAVSALRLFHSSLAPAKAVDA